MRQASVVQLVGLAAALAAGIGVGGCSGDDNVMAPGQPVNFEGKVRGFEGRNLDVSGGWIVVTDDGTQILRDGQKISLGQLQMGELVRVVGEVESPPSMVQATRINAF